jgi:hypothetical protein
MLQQTPTRPAGHATFQGTKAPCMHTTMAWWQDYGGALLEHPSVAKLLLPHAVCLGDALVSKAQQIAYH